MDTVGEGESGMDGESSISVHKLLGVRWTAGEKLLRATGSPVLRSVMIWRDGTGWGQGGQRGRGSKYNHGCSALLCSRNQRNIAKIKSPLFKI